MIKIAVIGFGNAGNQVANLAYNTRGIPAIAINSSDHDLSTVTIEKVKIGDKGSGKDRNIAKTTIKENFKSLYNNEVVESVVKEAEIVFLVSSTGGGTGSGATPLMYDLYTKIYASKKIILIGILPELRESIASQQNTIEYIKEMRNIENITYMLYDNNRKAHLQSSVALTTINEEIVEDMSIIRGDYQYTTPYNSIDEKDMFKIIGTPGMINISKVYDIKEKDIDTSSIEDMLIQYLKTNSPMCEIERDNIVKRLGLIVNLNGKLTKIFDRKLLKLKDFTGEPLEGFEHDFISSDAQYSNRVITIMSGLSIPDDRIEKIDQRIKDVTEALLKTKDNTLLDDIDINGIKELRKDTKKAPEQFVPEDIFDKYIK
jgi:tubulin-like protein CetZ